MLSGLSLPHIILLLVIIVLVFGTSKLKNAGKDLGGFFKGFKEGMKSEDKPGEAKTEIPPSAGQTIDGEVRKETTKS